MNIKIQCTCGTRYSFDVEPVAGRMPFTVQCPNCHVDGTAAANQLLAQAPLAVPVAVPVVTAVPVAPPAHPAQTTAPPLDLAAFKAKKKTAEEAAYRKGVRMIAAGVGVILLMIAAWAWFAFYASKPHVAGSLQMASDTPAVVRFLDEKRVLIATPREASLRDASLEKLFWTVSLSADADSLPSVIVDKNNLWICAGKQLKWVDATSGTVKQTTPIQGRFVSFTPADSSLLVVSEPEETRRIALHIDRSTGAVTTQDISVPRRETQTTPNDLPSNVLPTAGALTAQILDNKFSKTLATVSSEFFSTGKSLLEMRVKLIQPKVDYVQSIKPKGPSHLNGQTTTSTSAGLVAEEVFNDIKRSQTGGVRAVDNSRYEVRLRRWIEQEPVEWKGEVIGPPSFFSLSTVDLLVAGSNLCVFDKQNNKLFDTKLSYPISERFTDGDLAYHLPPAMETSNTLYFFDQGVLTAFSLPSGEVRWRLPSFGITALQADAKGMLYVDTTAGGPEDVKYADTITLEKIPPVLLKVDPANGKILWKAEGRGDRSFVSGKFVYSESVDQGGVALALALGDALGQPKGEGPVYFRLYRIDPDTGDALWSLYRQASPENVAVQDNHILLRFGNEMQSFKFLSF